VSLDIEKRLIGVTNDLERKITEHKSRLLDGFSKNTKRKNGIHRERQKKA